VDDEKRKAEEDELSNALKTAMQKLAKKGVSQPVCKLKGIYLVVYTHVSKKNRTNFYDCLHQMFDYYVKVLNSDDYKDIQSKFKQFHSSPTVSMELKRPLTVAVLSNFAMNRKMSTLIVKGVAQWLKEKREIDALIFYFIGASAKKKKKLYEKLLDIYIHGTAKKRNLFMRMWRKITKLFRKKDAKKNAKKDGDAEKKDGEKKEPEKKAPETPPPPPDPPQQPVP